MVPTLHISRSKRVTVTFFCNFRAVMFFPVNEAVAANMLLISMVAMNGLASHFPYFPIEAHYCNFCTVIFFPMNESVAA